MASIGTVTLKDDGSYVGRLNTLSIQAELVIRPVFNKEQENHPDFTVFVSGVECGAAWKRNNKKGEEYVSLSMSAPELNGGKKLYANLGRAANAQDDRTYAVIWNAQK